MTTTIAAGDVTEGMRLFVEFGPSQETSVLIREVVVEEDGSIGFDVERFGMITNYRADEMVSVEA